MDPELWRQVEDLYHRALELEESHRTAFLDRSCHDAKLRREVESLIEQERKAENFIEVPAMQVLGSLIAKQSPRSEGATADLQGRTISHYRVLEKLGGGGMGVVYKAEDLRLHRFVALKFMPGHLARDPQWLSRFQREAQAASALNHPNISTIYDIGEDGGNAFIAMEFLKGETLKQVIARGALATGQILDIGVQVANALEAAHGSGIVHRDVKPANIFICEGGRAKLLDFGVAKLTRELAAGELAAADSISMPIDLTGTGVAVGTAAYMSPEQVRGKNLDGRSDLFSLGVVLYEMAAGSPPFKGSTSGAVSAAILYETPRSPSRSNPRVPPGLEKIITRSLEKGCDLRYQQASDLAADLTLLSRKFESGIGDVNTRPSLLDWRGNVTRWARTAAVIVLVATAIAGNIFFARSRPKGAALTERDTVVLADFNNQTSDPVFSDALRQAFSSELAQSPFLNVMSDRKVNETLRLMGHAPGERITLDAGREICERNGAKALLAGAISSLGSVYLITLTGVACSTGDNLAQEQAEAASKETVLKALSLASSRLRTKLGESLPSVQKYETPVEATTSSLEALQNYSLGLRVRNEKGIADSIPFFKRAIELDPNFPMAYAELSSAYWNTYQQAFGLEYATKAYQLRDRVTEREKFRISTVYFGTIGETEKTMQAFQEWIATYPRDPLPHFNLAANYLQIGQGEKAVVEIKQALEILPDYRIYYSNLLFAYLCLDRLDEAQAAFDLALARGMDSGDLRMHMYDLAFVRGDTKAMQQQLAWFAGRPGEEDTLFSMQSDTEAYFGRMRAAREFSRKAVDSALGAGFKEKAALWAANAALREAEIGKTAAARKWAASALSLSQNKGAKVIATLALARSGDHKAETLAMELAKEYPTNRFLKVYWLPTIHASLELERNNSAEALRQVEDAESYELGTVGMFVNYLYPAYIRGEAFLLAHNGQAAAAEFQKVLDHPGLMENFVTGSLAYLQIGRAYAMAGNTGKATIAYQRFYSLWKNADPDSPVLKEAKLEYSHLHQEAQ